MIEYNGSFSKVDYLLEIIIKLFEKLNTSEAWRYIFYNPAKFGKVQGFTLQKT